VVEASVIATLPKVEVAFPVAVNTDADEVPTMVRVLVVVLHLKLLLAVKHHFRW
jgi:hypothetical protein